MDIILTLEFWMMAIGVGMFMVGVWSHMSGAEARRTGLEWFRLAQDRLDRAIEINDKTMLEHEKMRRDLGIEQD